MQDTKRCRMSGRCLPNEEGHTVCRPLCSWHNVLSTVTVVCLVRAVDQQSAEAQMFLTLRSAEQEARQIPHQHSVEHILGDLLDHRAMRVMLDGIVRSQ